MDLATAISSKICSLIEIANRYKIQGKDEMFKEQIKEVKSLKYFLVNAVNGISAEKRGNHLLEAENFLERKHLPLQTFDWNNYPMPQPALWIAILDNEAPGGFGLDDFLEGKCLEKHIINPLKVDQSVKYQKWIEALAFIFNDTKKWVYGYDYMTKEEIDKWHRDENEFISLDEDDGI